MKIEKKIYSFDVIYFGIFLLINYSQNIKAQCWSGNIQKGKRCTDIFQSVVTSSRKQCLVVCLQTSGCCSVNFNKNKKLCEMCTIKEDQVVIEDSSYSYIGKVDIMTNCGMMGNTHQSVCAPCMGPHPSLYKAATSIDLSPGYLVIRYTCTDGYITDGGTNTSSCDLTTKQWSVPSMRCKVPCVSSPPFVQNTETALDTSVLDNVYRYSCSSGYIHNGGSTLSSCDFSSKQWSTPSISCTECFENKNTFNKPLSTTHGDSQCRRWDDPGSSLAAFTNNYFEADGYSKANANAYCRHPRLEGTPHRLFRAPALFCATTDPNIERLLCAIPNCKSTDVQTCGSPPELSTTLTNTSFPVAADVFIASYKCLVYSGTSSAPHCPVSRCTGANSWTTPSVSCSTNDCISGGDFALYRGKRYCTESGRMCQSWASQVPHEHIQQMPASDKNYCRPAAGFKPWCYTTDEELRWEYCAVPNC